jgi:protein SCO1
MAATPTETPEAREALARSRRLRMIGYAAWGLLVVAAAVVALGYTRFGWFEPAGGIQAGAIGGPFTLVDQNGRTVTEKAFVGKPTAYFFGFTNCPEICPAALADMTARLGALGEDANRLNVVFVTLDPERDTPELLKTYLESFDRRIIALTGPPEAVADMARKFRVYWRKVGEGESYTLDHSTATYLMDPRGELLTLIDHRESSEAAMEKLRRLLES